MNIKTLFYGSPTLTPKQEHARMLFMYLVSGVLTTVVNFISFTAFNELVPYTYYVQLISWRFDLLLLVNQTIAWVLSVIAAYITNRAFVFVSKGNIIREFISFTAARLLSFFVIELGTFTLMTILCENALKIPEDTLLFTIIGIDITVLYVIKLTNSIIIVIANFVLSKIFVFGNKGKKSEKAEKTDTSKVAEPVKTEGENNEL